MYPLCHSDWADSTVPDKQLLLINIVFPLLTENCVLQSSSIIGLHEPFVEWAAPNVVCEPSLKKKKGV